MSSTDALLDTAFAEYNQGHFEQAENLAREVLSVEPTQGDALYLLGLIAFQAGALEPASKLLYQGVKLYPNMENYALALASVLHKQGRLDEALSFYEKYKDNPKVLSQIGLIYAGKGQDDWARSAFEEAIKKDEHVIEATLGLVALAEKNKDYDEALRLLLQAHEINPTAEVLYHLAYVSRQKGELSKALSYINKAVNIDVRALYLNERGLILEEMGNDTEALASYINATKHSPYYADAYANQGNIYQKMGQMQFAEDAYKRALQQDKSFLQAHHNLASLLYKQGRKGESLDHYQEAIILNPKHIPSIYNLAILLEDMKEYSEAAGLYFNAIALGMRSIELDLRISSTLTQLYKTGKDGKKEALTFAKGWVKNFPDNEIAKHTLSVLSGKKESNITDYAKKLFDVFAKTYDESMKKLACTAVKESIDLLKENHYEKVLDLACGTGTFAKEFKDHFNIIWGVDLSSEMLKKAEEKQIYTKLIANSVDGFFKAYSDTFDLIVAIELIGYLDDPLSFLQGVKDHLKQNGTFVLSVEQSQGKNVELSLSGRYLYAKSYIENLFDKIGFKIDVIKDIDLRKEENGVAKGFIVKASLL